jgi:hypothetical protein
MAVAVNPVPPSEHISVGSEIFRKIPSPSSGTLEIVVLAGHLGHLTSP